MGAQGTIFPRNLKETSIVKWDFLAFRGLRGHLWLARRIGLGFGPKARLGTPRGAKLGCTGVVPKTFGNHVIYKHLGAWVCKKGEIYKALRLLGKRGEVYTFWAGPIKGNVTQRHNVRGNKFMIGRKSVLS